MNALGLNLIDESYIDYSLKALESKFNLYYIQTRDYYTDRAYINRVLHKKGVWDRVRKMKSGATKGNHYSGSRKCSTRNYPIL